MNTFTFIIVCWLACAPFGYVANRWANRVMGLTTWTRMDQFGAILLSLFYGPLMVVLSIVFALLERLSQSKWAKKDAKW